MWMPGRGAESRWCCDPSQQFDRQALIIRQLYKLEPLFEYGINVGGLQACFCAGPMQAEQRSACATARGVVSSCGYGRRRAPLAVAITSRPSFAFTPKGSKEGGLADPPRSGRWSTRSPRSAPGR